MSVAKEFSPIAELFWKKTTSSWLHFGHMVPFDLDKVGSLIRFLSILTFAANDLDSFL